MAIDSAKKRASVLFIVWPDANGIDQSDRQTIAHIYGGVLATDTASTELACVAFSEGSVAAIAFSQGSVVAIAFAEGDVAAITFEGETCQ